MPKTIHKLTHRHHLAALLFASGVPVIEIKARTGYSTARLVQLQHGPEFNLLIETYRRQFFASAAQSFVQALETDTPRTFERLQHLRDQNADIKVSLGACNALFDRQVPRRTIHDEERTIRFIFSREDRMRIDQVMEESQIIEATATEESS